MGYPAKKISDVSFKQRKTKELSIRLVNRKKINLQKQPRYFTYVVKWDSGLAPNPFHRFCTLAVCKPLIRKFAQEGDWIIGLGSSNQNDLKLNHRGRLIYAMEVAEKITFNEYWKDKRFLKKRQYASSAKGRWGDNMYYMNSKGEWVQKTYGAHNTPEDKKRDTNVDAVLVSKNFFYFGKECIDLPKFFHQSVSKLKQGHKYKGLEEKGKQLIELLEKKYKKGRHGDPVGYEADNKGCGVKKVHMADISCNGCGS